MFKIRLSQAARVVALSGLVFAGVAAESADPPKAPTTPNFRKRPARIAIQSSIESASKTQSTFSNPDPAKTVKGCFELNLGTQQFPGPVPAFPIVTGTPVTPTVFELLCYNGKPVGPTITVKRGDKFCIRVANNLIPKNPVPTNTFVLFPPSKTGEQPHDFCITNLHTHGLHVRPDGKHDNIFQQIAPFQHLTLHYEIGGMHPAGTFWYHPHHHGSVAYQVSNGLAGALIVEGAPDDAWHQTGHYDVEDFPEIKAASDSMHQKIIVLQLYNFRTGTDPNLPQGQTVGRIDAGTIYNIKPTAYNCEAIRLNDVSPHPTPDTTPSTGQATAINGVINPIITMAPGEVQRWRLIHAGWDLDRYLQFVDANDQPAPLWKFNEIALDGLATGDIEEKAIVEIAPGQRSDVLIQVPKSIPRDTVFYLKQSFVPLTAAAHSEAQDPLYLAKIVVTGTPLDMQLPDKTQPAVRDKLLKCRPFTDIKPGDLSKPVDGKPVVLRFMAYDGAQNVPSGDTPYYTINDKTFHARPPMRIPIGTAQQWTLVAAESSHPFHIHVNAFEVISHKDASGVERHPKQLHQWRDTLFLKEKEEYTIRSRFQDFVGDSVLHCHILDHEDQGMMMCLRFYDPTGKLQPVGPGCPPQTLKQTKVPAPALKLSDVAGRPTSLTDLRGRKVVLVFFLGLGCEHCTGQLRQLLQEARQMKGLDAEIVAISGEPIPDVERARKVLDFSATDRFHLLVDPESQAFRVFQCYEQNELHHGLFLIDGNGIVRTSYIGIAPFTDTTAVLNAVRQLPIGADQEVTNR
jgi:FtsP/CotA-like multicopper oxidase with cupredoxin domain/peroxiredoxin